MAWELGFIGLGSLGGRMASRLAPLGDLTVHDHHPERMRELDGRARAVDNVAEVGRAADVVGVCVRSDRQVRGCLDELLPAMKPGGIVMVHSTISPDSVREVVAQATAAGVGLIEAPITVTRLDAAEGPFVFTLTGGEPGLVDEVRPLIDAYSTDHLHVGPHGSAVSLKIINNLVTMSQIVIAEEAFRLAAMTSVPAGVLKRVMLGNGALTPAMSRIADRSGEESPDLALRRNREVQATTGIKDLALAEELAKTVSTSCAAATFAKAHIWHAMAGVGPTAAW